MAKGGTTSTVTQSPDPWYKGELQNLYNMGGEYLRRNPFEEYRGTGVAGFNPMQMAAQDFLSRGLLGQSFPFQAPQTYGPYQPRWDPFGSRGEGTGYTGGTGATGSQGGTWVGEEWVPSGQSQMNSLGITQPGGTTTTANAYRASATGTGTGSVPPPPGSPFTNLPTVTPPTGGTGTMFGDYNIDALNQALQSGGYGGQVRRNRDVTLEEYLAGKPITEGQAQIDSLTERWRGLTSGANGDSFALWRNTGYGLDPSYVFANPEHLAQYFNNPELMAQAHANYTIGRDPNGPPISPSEYEAWVQNYQQQQQGTGTGTTGGTTPPPPGGTTTPPTGGGTTPPIFGMPGGNLTGITEAQQAAGVARGIAQSPGSYNVTSGNLLGGIGMYRDPYESGVVNQTISDLDRARQLMQVGNRSAATQAGAFGGDRQAIVEAETNRAYLDQVARSAGQLRSQGFDRAASLAEQDAQRGMTAGLANQNAYFQGRGQQLQGAGLLSSFGGDIFGRTLGTADALSQMGGQQQQMSQDLINADMARFYNAQNYPRESFNFLQGLLTGVPYATTTSTYTPGNRGASILGGALSGGGIGAGLKIGGSTGNPMAALIGGGLGGLLGMFT